MPLGRNSVMEHEVLDGKRGSRLHVLKLGYTFTASAVPIQQHGSVYLPHSTETETTVFRGHLKSLLFLDSFSYLC